MWFFFLGKLESVKLKIWKKDWAGGDQAYIRILQGNKRCRTKDKVGFYKGAVLEWTGNELGDRCKKITFDVNVLDIKFKIISNKQDAFSPERVEMFFNNTWFRSKIIGPGIWVNKRGMWKEWKKFHGLIWVGKEPLVRGSLFAIRMASAKVDPLQKIYGKYHLHSMRTK